MAKHQKTKCLQTIQKFGVFVSQAIANLNNHSKKFTSLAMKRKQANKNYRKSKQRINLLPS